MPDDIDIIAGTRRRAVVAKVLRQQYGGRYTELSDHIRGAAAVLLALDEDDGEREITGQLHEAEATMPSVEQQIRMAAVQALLNCVHDLGDELDEGLVSLFEAGEKVAAYIRDGKVGE